MANQPGSANEPFDTPTQDYTPGHAGAGPADAETLPRPSVSPSGNVVRPKIPGYEILAELGRGGMGVVYKAQQLSLNRTVALKMLLAGSHAGEQDIARFRREAEAVARLQHPNVVQIYEVGAADGMPFFSLEFVEGGSLADRLKGKPWAAHEAARLVEILARAVQAAHRQGIVHRDLKPVNVLITADDTPKIADFGLAKQVGSDAGQTRSGAVLGTPSYMAPEQAGGKGKQVGPAADVYALGAILYALLTGRPPFQAETAMDILLKVVSDEPVPPSRVQPKLPRDVETICLKCLQKEPGKRYASAEALADDLKRFLAGDSIHARPARAWERTLRWARRRAVLATILAASVAVALILIAAVAAVLWFKPGATSTPLQTTAVKTADEESLPPLPEDLALVPLDAAQVSVFHPADVLKSEGAKRLQARLLQEFPDWKDYIENWQSYAEEHLGVRPDEIERLTFWLLGDEDPENGVLVVTAAKPFDQAKLRSVLGLVSREEVLNGKTFYNFDAPYPGVGAFPGWLKTKGFTLHFLSDRILLQGSSPEILLNVLRPVSAGQNSDLRTALHRVAEERPHSFTHVRHIWDLIGEESDFRDVVTKFPQVRTLTEARSASLTINLKSAFLTVEGGDLILVNGSLAYENDAQVNAGKNAALEAVKLFLSHGRTMLNEMTKDPDFARTEELVGFDARKVLDQILLAFQGMKISRVGNEVHLDLQIAADVTKVVLAQAKMLGDAQKKAHMAVNRGKSADKLKLLASAMHKHHDQTGRLPAAAIVTKDGKPLLSWRVALLPYLDQEELFKQFKLDEAWDSPHNMELLAQMPEIFSVPGAETKELHSTQYRVFIGPGTAFDGAEGLLKEDFTDGFSNTILIVEAAEAVSWTKPDELEYTTDGPIPPLARQEYVGFYAAFADGVVRYITKATKEELLRRAIIRNDGQPFQPDDLNP